MVEIYLDDLIEEKQKEIIELLGGKENYDIFPLVTFEIYPEE